MIVEQGRTLSPYATITRRSGVVVALEDNGWGTVVGDDGDRHPFHSTAVADGSRFIDTGTPVSFVLVPGRQGRWEGSELWPRA